MIKPTVGRVVLFTPSKLDADMVLPSGGRCAAVIAHVWGDRMVNLAVFDANGRHFSKCSVALLQDDDAMSEHGYFCEWMPYQAGQAAKSEALEKQLAEAK